MAAHPCVKVKPPGFSRQEFLAAPLESPSQPISGFQILILNICLDFFFSVGLCWELRLSAAMAATRTEDPVADTPVAASPDDGKAVSEEAVAEPVSTKPADEPAPLSKNAQKKLLKRQRWVNRSFLVPTCRQQPAQPPLHRYEDKKAARKAAVKHEKHQATEQKKQDVQNLLEGMTEEEKATWKEERKHVRVARKAKTQEKRSRLSQVG